jgi:hypothetical protein
MLPKKVCFGDLGRVETVEALNRRGQLIVWQPIPIEDQLYFRGMEPLANFQKGGRREGMLIKPHPP